VLANGALFVRGMPGSRCVLSDERTDESSSDRSSEFEIKTRRVRVDGTRAEARGVRLHRVLFPLDRIEIFLIVEYLIFRKVCSRSREIDRDLGGAGLHSAYEAELQTKLEF